MPHQDKLFDNQPFPAPSRSQGPLSQEDQDACVQEIVRRIVAGFNPKRVFLFGSRARGDHHPDSDVDLLVEVEGRPDPFKLGVDMRRTVFRSPLGKDIIVVLKEDWEERAKSAFDIVRHAMDDGAVCLHER